MLEMTETSADEEHELLLMPVWKNVDGSMIFYVVITSIRYTGYIERMHSGRLRNWVQGALQERRRRLMKASVSQALHEWRGTGYGPC